MKYKILSIFVCLYIFSNIYSQVSSQGLVAYYPFNGNANDESGNGNNGSVYGATLTTDRFGNTNSAYHFNGYSDYIKVLDSEILQIEGPITISAWIRTNGTVEFSGIVEKTQTSEPRSGYQLYLDSNKKGSILIIYDHTITTQYSYAKSNYSLADNQWHHIVAVYDGNTIRLYADCALHGENGYSLGMQKNTSPLLIGWDNSSSSPGRYFNGDIDDIMIYNRALDSSEILELCNSNNDGLVAYYPFNGSTDDESGNGNHGINHGTTFGVDRCNNTNSACYFDGIDDRIELPYNLINHSEFSINFWLKTSDLTYSIVSGANYPNHNEYLIYAQESRGSFIDLYYHSNSGAIGYYTTKINPADNNWHMISIITKTNETYFYVDGLLYETSGIGSQYAINNEALWLGGDQDRVNGDWEQDQQYKGLLDDMSVFDRPLSSTEVFNLYNISCAEQSIDNINGDTVVCQNQQNVTYSISNIVSAVNYSWSYSGTGMSIIGNSNNITADFSQYATSGNLSVIVELSNGTILTSDNHYITVNSLPTAAGDIIGDNEVCAGENGVSYSIPEIGNATSYIWEYSGTGATIIGNSNRVTISFDEDAIDGYLTVYGYNDCGPGEPSSLLIRVSLCNQTQSKLKIPNSFTPNGDNINDYFTIGGLEENSSLIIFDRFGKKLYESSNYQNDWDGKDSNGNILPSDTYWYVLKMSVISKAFTGFIYLKR